MHLVDHHVYLDSESFELSEFCNLARVSGISEMIFSPPFTESGEPQKSKVAYWIQNQLLSSVFTIWIARTISLSFYSKEGKLRKFWKVLAGNRDFVVQKYPNNEFLLKRLQDFPTTKMWFWLSPDTSADELDSYSKNEKVFGFQIHFQVHEWSTPNLINLLDKISTTSKRKVYIIGSFNSRRKIEEILSRYSRIKFILGYGGFPYFSWAIMMKNTNENLWLDTASLHIGRAKFRDLVSGSHKRILFATDGPYNFIQNGNFSWKLFMERSNLTPIELTKNLYQAQMEYHET